MAELEGEKLQSRSPRQIRHAALIFGVVFAAAAFSTLTRSLGPLSAFWPANALLLGLLVRKPERSSLLAWICAFLAYVAADQLVGNSIWITLWLTGANLAGVLTGLTLFKRLTPDDRRLRRPESVLYLFVICVVAAGVTALVGAGATPIVYGRNPMIGFGVWFTTELANSIMMLPLVLAAPGLPLQVLKRQRSGDQPWIKKKRLIPGGIFLLSIVLASIVGGPGAIAIPVPALIWCAFSYDLFSTAAMTLLFSWWQISNVTASVLALSFSGDAMKQMMSVCLGIALLAIGPLSVACINASRNELLQNLNHAATHDYLTQALARGAFMQHGDSSLSSHASVDLAAAVLMLDIDHFKKVNDMYGHSVGDKALVSFASVVRSTLRDGDLFGRLGGEEFAVILPSITLDEAKDVAERIRFKVETSSIPVDKSTALNITVSIGVAYQYSPSALSLESIMSASDKALYTAKASGRNRVAFAEASLSVI
ncbi:GGDEF domain-containing protein [Acidicapsa ligni]|uniref:GGDEF domain-containing protein n=1 Tax=Acidicapsa ligni TaxID=542300 RepID=UPI0021E07F5E|nr:sensor domain-containing diguanylate cyclase [Acidicapsa ligni]